MGRIMAIDYGRKRSGLAVTDRLQLISNPLAAVASHNLLNYLSDYLRREEVELFVVGLPRQLNNRASDNMQAVEAFVARLKKVLPQVPVAYCDERFTSLMAKRTMIDGGVKKMKRRNKGLTDTISAVIILQSYMETKKNATLATL